MPEASCHCGAVRIDVDAPPQELNACQCSLCRRYGVHWAYYRKAAVRLPERDVTETYEWRNRALAFHRCRTCGCISHWASNDPARDRVAVNARLFDPADVADVPVRRSPGPP